MVKRDSVCHVLCLALAAAACSSPRNAASHTDSVALPAAESGHHDPPGRKVEISGTHVVSHGECPTECCHYGDWTMKSRSAIRARGDSTAPVIDWTIPGETVHADSGLVILDPVSVAVVDRDTTDSIDVLVDTANSRFRRDPRHFVAGDSILILTDDGDEAGIVRRGHVESLADRALAAHGGALRIVRHQPQWQWWAYVRARTRPASGWISVYNANIKGDDACGE